MNEQQELKELKELVRYYEKVIQNMSAPIIPSIVPRTILVPIAGFIYRDRFETIRTKVLQYASANRETENIVFDFTGVTLEDVEAFDYNELASELSELNSAQKLMGLRPIYVGFNPRFVREIVNAGIRVELEVYMNFKTALKILLDERERSLPSRR